MTTTVVNAARSGRKMTQCLLRKGKRQHTAWIPTKLATVGSYLKIKLDGTWNDGWKVAEAYPKTTRTEEDVLECERDHLKQRKASDI